MGIYEVDLTKDTIIVDGHVCKETEYKGIYKVQDEYIVNMDEWTCDVHNKNLAAIYLSDIDSAIKKIEFVTKFDNRVLQDFMDYLCKIDYTYTNRMCGYHDCPPMIGGFMLW